MPNTTWTEAAQEAIASGNGDDPKLYAFHFYHEDTEQEFFLVNDFNDHTFTLEDGQEVFFQKAGVYFLDPTPSSNGIQEVAMKMANVDRQISDFVESVKNSLSPVKVVVRQYLSSDKTQPAKRPIRLDLMDFSTDVSSVGTRATPVLLNKKPLTSELYTSTYFKGI